jgi:tetratricopeptide (TPR) repeat protein
MSNQARTPQRGFFPLPPVQLIVTSLLLFAAALSVHSRALDGQFLSWDDEQYLTRNLRIQNLTRENLAWFFAHPYFNSYTPLAFVSHAVDWYLWGPNPRFHHWNSLILHGLNSVALFWCGLFLLWHRRDGRLPMRDTSRGDRAFQNSLLAGAATAALLFAVHPLRVESVAWISDRKDLLAAFFGLATCLTYFRGTSGRLRPAWQWMTVSVILFALALLSKFLIVFLPLTFLIIEAIFLYPDEWQRRRGQLVVWKIPFLIPALMVGLVAVGAVGVDPLGLRVVDIPLVDRLALPFATPWFYLQKLLIPANLSPVYQVGITAFTWLAAIPVVSVTLLACILWRRKRPGVLAAWLVYLVLLSPTFLFLSPLIQHTADRHSYIATMSLFLLAGGGIASLWQRTVGEKTGAVVRLTLAALVLIIAAWHSFLTLRQTRVWENSVSLWLQVVTVSPDLPIGYLNLGNAVAAAGNTDDAIGLYRRATALEKGYGPAWTNMGVLYQLQGKPEEAEDSFRRSIAFNPEYFEAYINLGEVEEGKENAAEAAKLYRQAAWRNPGSDKPWVHLGDLFRREGETDSSVQSFEKALALNPYSPAAHWGIALCFETTGQSAEAKRHLLEAARLGHPDARRRLERGR